MAVGAAPPERSSPITVDLPRVDVEASQEQNTPRNKNEGRSRWNALRTEQPLEGGQILTTASIVRPMGVLIGSTSSGIRRNPISQCSHASPVVERVWGATTSPQRNHPMRIPLGGRAPRSSFRNWPLQAISNAPMSLTMRTRRNRSTASSPYLHIKHRAILCLLLFFEEPTRRSAAFVRCVDRSRSTVIPAVG